MQCRWYALFSGLDSVYFGSNIFEKRRKVIALLLCGLPRWSVRHAGLAPSQRYGNTRHVERGTQHHWRRGFLFQFKAFKILRLHGDRTDTT